MAANLSKALGVPHVELDALNWGPDWLNRSADAPEDFVRRVAEAAAGEAWVMDGNYSKARAVLWPRATAFVWMDTRRSVVMRQVFWRSFRRAVDKRELWSGSGNKELFRRWLDKEHPIRWAWDTWAMVRERYATLFAEGVFEGTPVYRVDSAREGRKLIGRLAGQRAGQGLFIPASTAIL
jgi:adenylate kinase family enzyme